MRVCLAVPLEKLFVICEVTAEETIIAKYEKSRMGKMLVRIYINIKFTGNCMYLLNQAEKKNCIIMIKAVNQSVQMGEIKKIIKQKEFEDSVD